MAASAVILALLFSSALFTFGSLNTTSRTFHFPAQTYYDATASGHPPLSNWQPFAEYPLLYSPPAPVNTGATCGPGNFIPEPCPPCLLSSFPLSDLASATWIATKTAVGSFVDAQLTLSRSQIQSAYDKSFTWLKTALYFSLLKVAKLAWLYALYGLCLIMSVLRFFLFPLFLIFSLILISGAIFSLVLRGIFRICSFIFSPLVQFIAFVVDPWSVLWNMVEQKQKKKDKIKLTPELKVKGLTTFSVSSDPPKGSVLEIVHDNGSHAGFATCLRLHSGDIALATADHIFSEDRFVRSFKTNIKIPLSAFRVCFSSTSLDICIAAGPRNWESLLGARAQFFRNHLQIPLGSAVFYNRDNSGWRMNEAKIQKYNKDAKRVEVLSNTSEGCSGTPYFVGNVIVGIHSSGATKLNCNMMAPIPAIPGWTQAEYVFEDDTFKGQGRAVSEEEQAEIDAQVREDYSAWDLFNMDDEEYREIKDSYAQKYKNNKKKKNQKHLADVIEEILTDPTWFDSQESFETAKPAATGQAMNQGNEQVGEANLPKNLSCGILNEEMQQPSSSASTNSDAQFNKILCQRLDKLESLISTFVMKDKDAQIVRQPQAQRRRRRNRGKGKQQNSNPTPKPSTDGASPTKTSAPSPASEKPASSSSATTHPVVQKLNGMRNSSDATQNWKPKPMVTGGQASAQKLKQKA